MSALLKWLRAEPDNNPIRTWTAIGLLVLIAVEVYLYFSWGWPFPLLFSITGTVCATVGSLWLASGVYLFASDQQLLLNGNPHRSKMMRKLASIVQSSARTVRLGVVYILLGAAIQIIHSALSAFGKFG